jgi:hypothetical protein
MQESSQSPTEKRGREENPGDSENPIETKVSKTEHVTRPDLRDGVYEQVFSLVTDGSIVVQDAVEFNRALERIAPSRTRQIRNAMPRNTIWGNVDFDVQMEMLRLVNDGIITVNDEGNLIRVMEIIAPLRLTPEKSPQVPDAPMKPEVFPVPHADDEAPAVRRRLNMGADEDDAQDEEGLTRLDLIDANTITLDIIYDPDEPNPIVRAFSTAMTALIAGDPAEGDHKNALELIARLLIGEGSLEGYKKRLMEETEMDW